MTGRSDDRGFTLVELLVTVVLIGIVVAPIAASFFVAFDNVGNTVDEFTESHDLLKASTFLVTDIQDADEVFTDRISQVAIDLNDIRYANGTTGWVAGNSGVVLLTTDQGASYTRLDTGSSAHLYGVGVPPGNTTTAWAFGAGATILKTSDGGGTWVTQSAPAGVTASLRHGHFKDASNGIIVGDAGTILKTVNGGSTWTEQVSTTGVDLLGVAFRDSNNGIAVGGNGITLYTSNYGGAWAAQTVRPPMTSTLRGVYVKDDKNGWVVGDVDPSTGFAISACSDRCTKVNPVWVGITSPGTTQNLRAVSGISSTNVWAAAAGGVIVGCVSSCKSAGSTWTPQDTGIADDINGIHAVDSTHVWASASAGRVLTYVLNRWAVQNPPAGFTSRLNAVWFRDTNKGIAVGNGGSAIVTTNAGTTWLTQSTGTAQDLLAVRAVSSTVALAVGNGGVIRVCTANCENSSANWVGQVSTTLENLYGLSWKDSGTVWAVGGGGTMRICTNNCDKATAVWAVQTQVLPVLTAIRAVQGVAGGEAYAVGDGGKIFVCSSNCDKAAATWTQPASPSTANLTSVTCPSSSKCYAVGDAGTILTCDASCKTAGSTWAIQDSGTTANLTSVRTVSSTVAYAVGESGTVVTTTDGGVTWVPEAPPIATNLLGLSAPSAANQWAVGQSATIITTVSGGTAGWQQLVDETLEEVPAKVCDGVDPILVAFWSTDPDGTEVAITYLVQTVGGERVLVRQVCARSKDAPESDPFTLVNRVTAAHRLAPTNDPVLSCFAADGSVTDCPSAAKIQLTFSNPGGQAYTVRGARR